MSQSRIVIAGGGVAGHKLAHALQDVAEVTLIDPKPFLEIPMAVPRLFVAPRALPALVPYADFLSKARHLQGTLATVAPGEVMVRKTDGGDERAPYDILVLATGANYGSALVKPSGFSTLEDRWSHFERIRDLIEAADRILVVGGGAVGVETVGEIVQTFPRKTVTLVEAGPRLLPPSTEKAAAMAAAFLKKRGVQVLTGESLLAKPPKDDVDSKGGEVSTDKGTVIAYDLALWCVGTKPDAGYMAEHFPQTLNARGEIQVEPTLQVKGLPNVFALGDVADFSEKGASWARFQGQALEANLKALLQSGPGAAMKSYKPAMPVTSMIVTLGRNNGVAAMPFGTIGWPWLLKKFKSETMFVPSFRKGVGLS